MDPQKISAQRIALIAWNKSTEKNELDLLRKALVNRRYRVDVVHELSQLDKQLREYEQAGEVPVEVITHYHFPKITLGGLNRRIQRKLNAIAGAAKSRFTSVTQRLLGADLHQFAIDSAADEMIKAADLPNALLKILQKENPDKARCQQKYPVVHAHLENPELESALSQLFDVQKQKLKPINLKQLESLSAVEGGVLLVTESVLQSVRESEPGRSLLDFSEVTGVVVILDKADGEDSEEERERELYSCGALDCIFPGTGEIEIVNRTLGARRNRARSILENQYHNALRKNSREWKVFQEVSSLEAASIIHDDNGKIYFVNEAATNLFGYDEKSFEQMHIRSLHPRNYEKTRREIYENFLKNGSVKWEAKFVKANGEEFDALLTAAPANEFSSDGRHLICAHIHSLEHYKFLKKSVSKMISADPETLDFQIRTMVSEMDHLVDGIQTIQVYKKIRHYAQREPLWTAGRHAQPPRLRADHPVSLKHVWSIFEEGEKLIEDDSDSSHLKMPHAVREVRSSLLTATGGGFVVCPLKIGEKVLGCIAVELEGKKIGEQWDAPMAYRKQRLRDFLSLVSLMIASGIEQKRVDANRKNLEQLSFQEDKKRSINNITDGIAHDFNNLLQSISDHVSLLLRSEEMQESEKKSLRSVKSAAELGASLSSRIRDLSTPSTKVSKFSLHRLINEVSDLVKSSLVSNQPPRLNLESGMDVINCDRSQVHQVFMNLFSNANDAMKENANGRIAISTRYRKNEFDQGVIQVVFSDEGPGINEKDVFNIFEPYFSTKKETKQGTGMGLWIISRIMRHHGGNIRVGKNQPGATFILEWPLVDAPEEKSEFSSGIFSGKGTVLVVDDDPMVNESCKLLLEHMGFDVLTAFDGYEALNLYGKFRSGIDLVILDQRMPGMSGQECLTQLLKLNPDVKVIVCSGNEIQIGRPDGGRNVVGVLSKPYTLRDLGRTMRRAEVLQD